MDRPLGPLPNWTIRWVAFGVLILPAVIARTGWPLKLCAMALVASLVGSARDSRVAGAELVTRLFVGFIPLKPERCKLKFIVQIETENRRDVGAVDLLFFAGIHFVMDRVMQWVWPWMVGELELWVVTARDKRILAWRGNGDEAFQTNLATLMSATGASVKRT